MAQCVRTAFSAPVGLGGEPVKAILSQPGVLRKEKVERYNIMSTPQKNSTVGNNPPIETPNTSVYPEGEYRVGTDIPAGEYRFTPKSDARPGYYCAYSDTSKKDIVHNDNFRGTAYYTVTNGQLLCVNAATFELIAVSDTDSPSVPGDSEHSSPEEES